MAHGFAVDPRNGDVYIGDREDYRIVVYTGTANFCGRMQTRNLICALYFDKQAICGWPQAGRPFLKLTSRRPGAGRGRNGNGTGTGQFLESPPTL
jgi:hypothetical protein